VAGFSAGALGVAGAAALIALCLITTGEEFLNLAKMLVAINIPAVLVEGAVTAFIVLFLIKVKPELFNSKEHADA
jgi:cobalt/nickel transport system permease protein